MGSTPLSSGAELPRDPPEVFVYRPGAVGDALLAAPALAALRHRFPCARIVLASQPAVGPLLLANRLADTFISQDAPELLWLFGAGEAPATYEVGVLWASDPDGVMARALRRAGAHCVVSAPSRPAPGSGVHASDHLLRSLAPLGVPSQAPPLPPLAPPATARDAAETWLRERAASGQRLAALHPGSGSPGKNWPLERFMSVAERLASAGLRVLWVVGPADEPLLGRLRPAAAQTRWLLAAGLDLATVAALLARCAIYLGNDSGISHLAARCGVPSVVLFGPSDPALWAPRSLLVEVLSDPGWARLTPDAVAAAMLRVAR